MVKQSGGEGVGATYKVEDTIVCRKAFKAVFCIGNDRLRRIFQFGNHQIGKSPGRPIGLAGLVVRSWMKDFFKTRVESLPNKDNIVHLPDNYSKTEVWKIYQSTVGNSDLSASVGYRQFAKIWKSDFPQVKIPTVNRFSTCANCEEFKSMRDKADNEVEKRKYVCFLENLLSEFIQTYDTLLLHNVLGIHILFSWLDSNVLCFYHR